MLLGYSRGSVGDVVFYRDGGSQRQRARNRKPNNPNTEPQVKQRSRFANAVKFFKQVNSSFFKFAFEDKKTNESDYNAFMRHNVARSGYIGAAANKIANWPALGLWQMSDGSLPEISAPLPQPVSGSLFFDAGAGVNFSDATSSTVSSVSQALTQSSIWREGDILTAVAYVVYPSRGLPTVDTETFAPSSYFGFTQFILNSADNSALPVLTIGNISFDWVFETGAYIGFSTNAADLPSDCLVSIALIHSRNTSTGLQVSPAVLAWVSWTTEGVIPSEIPIAAMATDSAYYQQVLADWQAAALAVLQGGAVAGGGGGGTASVGARVSFNNIGHAANIPGSITLSVGSAERSYFQVAFWGTNWGLGDVSVSSDQQETILAFELGAQYITVDFGSGTAPENVRPGTVVTVSTPAGPLVVNFVA